MASGGVALLLWDAIESLRVTDAQLAAGAPEDFLGVGLYPTLLLFALPAFCGLVLLWGLATRKSQRIVATLGAAIFLASVALNVWAYNLLSSRTIGK